MTAFAAVLVLVCLVSAPAVSGQGGGANQTAAQSPAGADTTGRDAAQPDTTGPAAAEPDTTKQDAATNVVAGADTTAHAPARPDSVGPSPAKPDTTTLDVVRQNVAGQDTTGPAVASPDSAGLEGADEEAGGGEGTEQTPEGQTAGESDIPQEETTGESPEEGNAQVKDTSSVEEDWAASWLWDWNKPYSPETLMLAGGGDVFMRHLFRLRSHSTVEKQVYLDLRNSAIRELTLYRGRRAAAPIPMTIADYRPRLTRQSLRTQWVDYGSRGLAKAAGEGAAPVGTLKLELPVAIPKSIQKIIGRGKPNLRVSGSETISISGRSTWQVGQKANEAGRQSKFPQLNLKQELAVNVSGDIGDKINVDIDQNSQESLSNRIRINYRGYEDEILQTLDLGNTNLSLPGAQFVSYNGRHQGLFGVKANARLGDLDLTVIASKQEGQTGSNRFVGSSTVRTTTISDVNYSARTFYFLGDPREWPFNVDLTTLEVFVDDRNSYNDDSADPPVVPCKAYVWKATDDRPYPETPPGDSDPVLLSRSDGDTISGKFNRLTPGVDYQIIWFYEDCPTIWLTRALNEKEVLAVAYTDEAEGQIGVTTGVDTLQLRLLKASSVDLGTTADGFYDPESRFYPTIRYEMKNIYNLGATEILAEGFDITILPKSGTEFDDDRFGRPYIEVLGLDRLDQNGFSVLQDGGPDGEIDVEQGSVFLRQGLLVFPDLRPFAPDEVDAKFWRPLFFPEAACLDYPECGDPQSDPLIPLMGEEAVPEIYDRKNVRANEDTQYEMTIGYLSSLYGETIFLKGNVLEGSETVTANGQRLERGRDYNIDYDSGAVNLISDAARESAADITIDYSFKPLFALGQRTLLGFSSSYAPVEDYAVSTTWIYESKGATERRPKLGEEPSLTVIGDLAGTVRKSPASFTRFIDKLPLISTDSPSSINLAGEVGMSFPNPNTENHGYVEDFESSRDDFAVDLSRLRWFYSSYPVGQIQDTLLKGALRWYNPRDERRVRADYLQPDLTSVEADDSVESMEIDFTPRNGDPESWAGLTQMVSSAGADFSRKQYIDFWVNDGFRPGDNEDLILYRNLGLNPDSATIYIDVGTISEDAMWSINELPNARLDTEDQSGEGELDESDFLQEDTGLDGVFSASDTENPPESGPTQTGVESTAADPNGDDYDFDPDPDDRSPSKFARINGTEDNDRLDTEDLNRDGILGTANSYFHYEVNLADPDSKYLVAEILDNGGNPTGWRRYRVPVRGGAVDTVGSPSLDSVEHVRIWVSGFSTRSRLQIARMAFTGNRWTREGIADSTGEFFTEVELDASGEEFLVGVVNNKEDETYSPPFDAGEDGNIERREQSLLITYNNLGAGHTGSAFRAFDPAKDFTLYREVKFYVRSDRTDPDLDFFIRFGDEKRYYEIEFPLKQGWQEIIVDLQELTSLKSDDLADSVVVGSRTYKVEGEPRFNQVRRITAGVTNNGDLPASGEIWFNDIRLGEVRRDIGVASRFNMQVSLADFMNFSTNFDAQDEDFLGIGQNRGSGLDRRRMSVGGKINAHKLVAPLHLTMPVSFNWSENRSVPEFRTGDDRELLPEQTGQERTISRNTSFSADLARSPSRNPFLRYTIDALRANVQYRKARSVSPVRADTTEVVTTRFRYDVTPPQKTARLFPGLNVGYLPSNISMSFGTTTETRTSFDKDAGEQTKNVTLKPATMQFDTGYRPVSSLAGNFSIVSNRDLRRKNNLNILGGINIGTEVNRQENVRANFSPRIFWWLGSPSFNYTGAYKENHNPSLTNDQDREAGETRRNVNNSSNYRTGLNVPWGRFMGLVHAGGDSLSAANPADWGKALFSTLAQFSQITLSYTVTDRSSYSGVYGVPDLGYKLGFSRDLGRESRPAPSGSKALSTNKNTEARTDGAIFKDYRVSISYSRDDRDQETTSGTTYDRSINWPDLKIDVSALESKLRLKKYLTRLSAQSAYQGSNSKSVTQGGKQKTLAEIKSWRPLVSLNAVWEGGLSTNFSVNRRSEERGSINANVGTSRIITTESYNLNLQKTIKGGEGVQLPFGGGRKTQKTINISINLSYNKNKSERDPGDGRPVNVDAQSDKLRAISRATYNFSSNMVGTLEINFDQTRNRKLGRTIRGIGVNASARLRF